MYIQRNLVTRSGGGAVKRQLLLSVVLSLSAWQVATGQAYSPRNLWRPFITIGYGYASVGDVSNFYHGIVQSYQNAGIHVPTQTDFGPTLDVGGGILYSPIEALWLGLSLDYIVSPAYSDYQDYAGTLKIDGAVTRYQLAIIARCTLTRFGRFPLLLTARPGVSLFSARITQEIRFKGSSRYDYQREIQSSSAFPCLEMTLGTSVPTGPVISTIAAGYRLTISGAHPYSTTTDPPDPQSDRIHSYWVLSDTGFLVKLSFALQF